MHSLFFYPANPFEQAHGTHIRMLQFAKHLREKGGKIDLLSINGLDNVFGSDVILTNKLFNKIEIVDWSSPSRAGNIWKNVLTSALRLLPKFSRRLPNLSSKALIRRARELFSEFVFDVFFVYSPIWADLVYCAPDRTLKILLVEDIWTFQECRGVDGVCQYFGRMIEDEINRMRAFDYIITISRREQIFLGCLIPERKFIYMPMFFLDNYQPDSRRIFDLVLVASDNPHNQIGLQWFFNNVEPLIPPDIQIAIAGYICNAVPNPSERIYYFGKIDDLSKVYNSSKVAFSPLLSGSGQKIKVVEAISYGLPVVGTSAGLEGIEASAKDGCYRCDLPEHFARLLTELSRNESLRKEASLNAHRFFLQNHTEEAACRELDAMIF